MRILYLIMIFACMAGCSTPNFTFPNDIKSQCYGAKNSSKMIIESVKQKKLKELKGCRVTKIPGEKRGVDGWVYTSKNGTYAYGSCNGTLIKIACNPTTGGDINVSVLEHEFAHYWIMSNFDDWTHNPIYDGKFHGWKFSRDVSGSAIEIDDGKYTHVDYMEN